MNQSPKYSSRIDRAKVNNARLLELTGDQERHDRLVAFIEAKGQTIHS